MDENGKDLDEAFLNYFIQNKMEDTDNLNATTMVILKYFEFHFSYIILYLRWMLFIYYTTCSCITFLILNFNFFPQFFIPVCINNHYTLYVVNTDKKACQYLDNLPMNNVKGKLAECKRRAEIIVSLLLLICSNCFFFLNLFWLLFFTFFSWILV